MKVASVFLLLIVGFIICFFVRQEKNHEKEQVKIDKVWQSKLDSLETAYKDSLHSRELFYLKSFTEAIQKSDFYEGEAMAYKRKYFNEKNKHRTFSDTGRDSLVSAIGLN